MVIQDLLDTIQTRSDLELITFPVYDILSYKVLNALQFQTHLLRKKGLESNVQNIIKL